MCDPASIIGGLFSLAGSMAAASQQAAMIEATNKANRDAYELSKNAREAEIARQQGFEQAASAYWDQTANNLTVEDHDADREAAEQKFMETFDEQTPAIEEGQLLSGQEFATEEIKNEIANRTNAAAAEARKRVQALAALSAFGMTDVNRTGILGQNADMLTTLNSLRRGSLGVSQHEQSISPAQVSQGSSIFGDVLSGVGGIVSSYGGGKKVPVSPKASAALSAGGGGIY